MFVKMLKSKLHLARVTDTKPDYSGSIAIDPNLLEAVDLKPYEMVLIADSNNGNRFETYVVPAERGSGDIIVMGPAAKLVEPKDIIIILNFAYFTPDEAKQLKPKIIVLDENNNIEKTLS